MKQIEKIFATNCQGEATMHFNETRKKKLIKKLEFAIKASR